ITYHVQFGFIQLFWKHAIFGIDRIFLLIGPVLFMGITTIWSNIKQKVSDELYARAIEIVNDLDTSKIEKTFTEFNDKLTAKVDTSISNFKSTFIAEISKIYAEIDGKLTAEAEKTRHVMMTSIGRRRKF